MKTFSRGDILTRLRSKIDRREPILMGGAGIALIAKVADSAGIDVLMAYNTGPFRMDGHGSLAGYLAYGDANRITADLARTLLPVVRDTPVVCGIGAADPYTDVEWLVDEFMTRGFSGVTNVPTAGIYDGVFRQQIDATNLGYPREVDLIAICRARKVFTVAYVFSPAEAQSMAEAGADVIAAHVGLTTGGLVGARPMEDLDSACTRVEEMAAAAQEIREDIIVLAHGGPLEDPASVQVAFDRTSVHGYLGASSIERLPVEHAVAEIIHEFRSLRMGVRQ